jgi:hypothetical protein
MSQLGDKVVTRTSLERGVLKGQRLYVSGHKQAQLLMDMGSSFPHLKMNLLHLLCSRHFLVTTPSESCIWADTDRRQLSSLTCFCRLCRVRTTLSFFSTSTLAVGEGVTRSLLFPLPGPAITSASVLGVNNLGFTAYEVFGTRVEGGSSSITAFIGGVGRSYLPIATCDSLCATSHSARIVLLDYSIGVLSYFVSASLIVSY